jgi:hypothetical protein
VGYVAGGRETNDDVYEVLDSKRRSGITKVICGLEMAQDRVVQLSEANSMISLSHHVEFRLRPKSTRPRALCQRDDRLEPVGFIAWEIVFQEGAPSPPLD